MEPELREEPREALFQVLGCYFYQYWESEFASEDAAIDAIRQDCPAPELTAAISELDRLIASGMSDAELARILLDDYGCYYYPPGAGMTCVQWLSNLRAKFAAPSA